MGTFSNARKADPFGTGGVLRAFGFLVVVAPALGSLIFALPFLTYLVATTRTNILADAAVAFGVILAYGYMVGFVPAALGATVYLFWLRQPDHGCIRNSVFEGGVAGGMGGLFCVTVLAFALPAEVVTLLVAGGLFVLLGVASGAASAWLRDTFRVGERENAGPGR